MGSIRLLAVTVLAVVLALSSAQSVSAGLHPSISLSRTCGAPGTVVLVSGSGFGSEITCEIYSTPSGLVGPTEHVDWGCTCDDPHNPSGWFIVQPGASGAYTVTLHVTAGSGASASAEFTAGACPAVGGVVMSVNTLTFVSPWLVVIGLVGCVAAVVVVAKKRLQ